MRLDNEKPSSNIEDQRGRGGGFGFPGGGGGGMRRVNIPMGGRGGFSIKTIIFLVIIYFVLKMLGIDLLGGLNPGQQSQFDVPDVSTDVVQDSGPGAGTGPATADSDAGRNFVSRVLGSTERVWSDIFKNMGQDYPEPKLVLFSGFVQSACGMAQSAMGPFYCPRDQKVYIDLSFYQDMKNKLGAPGDFAQAYVIAHEVGHHVQRLTGVLERVQRARQSMNEAQGNALQVRVELQADCYAGVWAHHADRARGVVEPGDIDEALNAAAAIGDDRLQKRTRGTISPESFTHGTSEQRARWFRRGFEQGKLNACDTFNAAQL